MSARKWQQPQTDLPTEKACTCDALERGIARPNTVAKYRATSIAKFSMTQVPNNFQPPQAPGFSDEIDLMHLPDQFLRRWRWWTVGAVLGGGIGLALCQLITPQYEASGIVRLAPIDVTVGLKPGTTSAMPGTPVGVTILAETVPEAIARMQSKGFQQDVARQLQKTHPGVFDTVAASYKEVKKSDNYLQISARAAVPAAALATVNTTADLLSERHKPLIEKAVERVTKEGHRQAVSQNATGLIEPAGLVGPVSPNKPLLLTGGIALGATLGALLGFMLPAWRTYRDRTAQKVNNASTVA